ncbi:MULTISPECIES: FKBP-type peptidyl-prolyl cis-trans isomerase [Mycobacteriaceae]|uniref:Peptidyl-prolyl cis-trans isomerase n=4 Tax=Mycobacteriaceae TaxID=1762 RepID=F5YSI1_MYCSD|nr:MULTISPECIES: FKBP-type peptidyl-prolyl cis-trans isomerase [Mycobacteriaceae]AEF34817.1 FK-506 binding protein peptidyl-prolyl cis- trans isomerase [Mycolicibacter sinensis]OQZ97992.1 peptidylprolyl isomerase [Mycolicibacter algericus DSM 45454]BBX11945.1 peptidyl-prolyl cis-trans isomerase [Mycobacterium novum]GFG83636.1 peptidyl-prolyl cis-trans isomerase [Mycolicibacter algericus]
MTKPGKPQITVPAGPPPTELVIEDIVVGDGAEAAPGALVNVHYLGVDYDSGAEFDSSWNRGEPLEFPLDGLIAGWQDGIPGMKVGGRRQLVIPPELAYGPAGTGHQLAGKTLVFMIDLLGTR